MQVVLAEIVLASAWFKDTLHNLADVIFFVFRHCHLTHYQLPGVTVDC